VMEIKARAKKFKDVLNGLIQELWAQANSNLSIARSWDFPRRSSRLIKRKLHHRLWRLPYAKVLVCHKQRVEVIPSNLSIERSWVPFRCWVSLFLTGFTSACHLLEE
jgi:hypothetical protein